MQETYKMKKGVVSISSISSRNYNRRFSSGSSSSSSSSRSSSSNSSSRIFLKIAIWLCKES